MKSIQLLVYVMILPFLLSCSKEEDDLNIPLSGLGGDTWEEGPIDAWLYENYVVPYNIEVKYRFDQYELALNKVLVPPKEEKIILVMQAIKSTWIAPYVAEAGETFIKKLAPKQFVLVGSPEFNNNGTITLGTAEGGLQVVLFKINDFEADNEVEVKQMLHTIHHEFGHILHQNIMYPEAFKNITTSYTASWNDFTLEDARSRGYITQYARSKVDDDFVEMISIMLIEGKEGFDAIVNSTPEAAQELLRQKEQIVVGYFKEAWGIDIYSLQTRTQLAIEAL